MQNPYEPKSEQPGPISSNVRPLTKPKVCLWYNVYCSCMLLLYVVVAALGVAMVIFIDELSPPNDAERAGNIAAGILMAIASVGMMLLFALGLLIPRRKWGWVYGFIPIAIGLTSPCCIPASLPLLWFWLKPENKEWFNVG